MTNARSIFFGPARLGNRLSGCLCAVVLTAILAGCGGEPPKVAAPGKQDAAKPASMVSAASSTANTPGSPFPKSVFVKNPLKNPFYPARPETRNDAPQAAQPSPSDAARQLREKLSAGFMGVMGAGEERMAVINDIILHPGGDAEIPLTMDDGKQVVVKVKCLKILRNSVLLKVDGQEKPVTVTLTPKFK